MDRAQRNLSFSSDLDGWVLQDSGFPKSKGAPQGAPFASLDGDTGGANAARDHCE